MSDAAHPACPPGPGTRADVHWPGSDPFSITVLLAYTPDLFGPAVPPLTGGWERCAVWPGDVVALRSAIRLADAWGAKVQAVSFGPFASGAEYRRPAELGVDSVRLLPGDPAAAHHERALALAAASHGSGVVFAGSRGPGHGSGAVPVYVAGVLRAACVTEVVSVAPGPPGVLLVERTLDGCWRETVEIVTPCVLSCAPGS